LPVLLVDSQWDFRDGWCTDLSRGGLKVRSAEVLLPGKIVEVWLNLPRDVDVQTEAEVLHTKHNAMGLRFLGMTGRQWRRLELSLTGHA
jgi:hypothetical protein